ncbi:MAG: alpha/beta hydrolase [Cyanobacteria bacterium K_DeepCast_0m_m1_088]|nr:alpha/beta hydrolase [Cyanobacteria bacterium K_DeepCast_0m_m1_088]
MPENPQPSSLQLIDGPASAPATLLLAHGAGAPMDSPFMQTVACGLAGLGWRVVRFEFPYMAQARLSGKRRAPDRQPVLLQSWRDQVAAAASEGPLFIGGKSMGGRMASLVLEEQAQAAAVLGCLCLGYPFHPPGKPDSLRIDHLQTFTQPVLVVQGERDSFGRRAEVESYELSSAVQLHWIADGDHSFKPTKRSGLSESANLEQAIAASHQFMAQIMASTCRDRSDG